ncbi:lytic transglycosylase domain-containing protein [Aquibium oceanicum]|uniref:Transglycosylase SLT domain-containing protein n=1 Tax=Aquibium oceanicum TaxID=1670800 RepID=A0A1L3SU03_9HYPH|nr:transglycosylase SLT domain-containing protein [Aquibium oceanicum]APH72782.1 hypothetical protein BSQ44_16480 [Aquibium oceanicum]
MNRNLVLAAAFVCGVTNSAAIAQEAPSQLSRSELAEAFASIKGDAKDSARNSGAEAETAAPAVDNMTTASIDPRGRPALMAVAREAAAVEPSKPEAKAEVKVTVVKNRYSSIISSYASAYGVPVALATAVVGVESNFRPDVRGSAGEIGLMQIKPTTARMMGYTGSAKGLYDPDTNIRYGMKYLAKAHQLGGGDTCGTILRYNAGHGAKRMNSISAAYCAKVKRQIGG